MYTHGHHESVLRSHRWRTIENSAAYLVPYLSPGKELLDVGCGPGTITADFAKRLRPGRVLGIDPSADAINAARRDHPGVDFAAWCFATPEDRAWWGGLWADRMTTSAIAQQAQREGRANADELASIADAWRRWANADDGWFAVLHGEVLCTR